MGNKTGLYIKIILAQIAGYFLTVFLLQHVFLGPVPAVRAEFFHDVEKLPYTVRDYIITVPSKISQTIAKAKLKKELASKTPPPWVFDPLPGEVVPTQSGRYTGPTRTPKERAKNPLPTEKAGDPQRPRPTNIPEQVRPTRPPQPTQAPIQPTSVPANPSTLEQEIFQLVNQRRKAAGLNELALDGNLSTAAKNHSTYMAGGHGMERCNHFESDGSSPVDRAKTAGFNGILVGETVGCMYTTAQGIVDGWWSSPGHKAILTSSQGRLIGVGWSQNYQTALVAR